MAITPNYSWPLPDDTDLVKDGAEAIRDLGNAIDTTVDGLGVGLVHIETQTFSAVSSVDFDNVFTSDYRHYRLVLYVNASTGGDNLALRVSAGGTPATGSNYVVQEILANGSSVSSARGVAFSNAKFSELATTRIWVNLDIFSPQVADRTCFLSSAGWGENPRWQNFAIQHQLANAYDGIRIFPGAGTITGNISIFGYKEI
jgi:hypothetical protein